MCCKQQMLLFRVLVVIGISLVGCQKWNGAHRAPTIPSEENVSTLTNYFVTDAEDSGWTTYYKPGDSYFKVTIPVSGAVKIEYTVVRDIQTRMVFIIILHTTRPTTHQIGLTTFDVDGQSITDVVDCLTVTYLENGEFLQKPVTAVEHASSQYIHYRRQTSDNETQEWWPVNEAAQFVFSMGVQQTVRPYCQGKLLVDEGTPAVPFVPAPTHLPGCTVTTAADDATTPPKGSLRQVLANSPCCTAITFESGINTITLAGTQLVIPGTCANLTIDGGSGVTISGNNASRVMYVSGDANVTIRAVTITNGKAGYAYGPYGGGIYNNGTLTITNSASVSGNNAGFGGGIYNDYATLTVNGTVSGNVTDYLGGGIYNNYATLTVNGTVSDNTAQYGGGIYNNYATLTISGTVSGNTAQYGGGILNYYGALMLPPGHVIQGNYSDNIGGGIYTSGACPTDASYGTNNFSGSGATTIDNCTGSL